MTSPKKTEPVVVDLTEEPEAARLSDALAEEIVEAIEADADLVDEDGEAATLPARAIRNPDGSITLPLRYPRTLTIRTQSGKTREERYDRLVFHRLTGDDMLALAAAADADKPVVLFARALRLPGLQARALFKKLDAVDVNAGVAVISFLSGSGPTTGR